MTARRWPILAIFMLSGAAGLVYEVVWARQLVLVFGNTTQAVSAILTGFFGGMAIGSWLGGRLADRVRRPLRLYGLLELVLVVIVLLTPATFRLIHEIYRGAFGLLESAPQTLALVRFGLALLALAPATVLMGATLPTLTRYLSRDSGHLSSAFGRLYAANTVGAIIGAAGAGLVLIELVGLTGTLLLGATCSGVAGTVALLLDRRRAVTGVPLGARQTAGEPDVRRDVLEVADPPDIMNDGPRPGLALAVAFVSGLTSLGYQVLWTRLLASGSGNSTYVFTLILSVFLIGLALGALFFTVLRQRIRHPISVLALAQVVISAFAFIGLVAVISQPAGSPFKEVLGGLSREVIVVVLPATMVMGLSFPAASALVADEEGRIATRAGLLLASNTLGAIIGTFVVPFFLIPAVGSPSAVGILALVNAGTGIALALGGRVPGSLSRAATAGAGGALSVVLGVSLLAGGLLRDPSVARIEAGQGTVFASREDEIASVQAGAVDGVRQLWVTGTSMTLLTVDAKLMPILPLMLRPQSKTALTVAFGMGSAFRAAVIAGLQTDAVELVPSVLTMFGYFYPDAPAILASPAGHVIVADGRNHVELTDRRYDIIVTDPPPPIESSGVSVISSLEYYRAGRARLTPGGVMMQWVPYGQTVDEFRAHVRTFRDVYRFVLVLRGPGGYGFYMLGSDEPIVFTNEGMRAVLARPGILADISSAYDSPAKTVEDWLGLIPRLTWISGDQVSAFAGDAPLITDDRPLPEYFLLRHRFGRQSPLVSAKSLAAAGYPLQ